MLKLIHQSAEFIRNKIGNQPHQLALILGSGMGGIVHKIEITDSIDYSDIPNFPVSTVDGHDGKLIMGKLSGVPMIALQGRFHYYEGYSLRETTFPIRVLKALGVHTLLLSNASGGLNPKHQIGDLMLIEDHIHMFPDNPLRGKNIEALGARFPDMSQPYCTELLDLAERIAAENDFNIHRGVYLGTSGPNYETKAEYKFFRTIGADAVGMSTTAETIVAVHSGMRVFGVSVIADLGVEGQVVEISHEDVQAVAATVEPMLNLLFREMLKELCSKESLPI